MLIPNTLLVDSHTGNRQQPVLLLEPPGVQLAVRDNPEEDQSQRDGQEARHEEDDLPGVNSRAVEAGSDRDAVRHEATEDLAPAVEAEPDVDSAAVL